jgi:hypothetical protein
MSLAAELTCAFDNLIRDLFRNFYNKVKEEKREMGVERGLGGRFGGAHERKEIG